MPEVLRPGAGIVFMKVGTHAGEGLSDIIERRRKEIEDAGYALDHRDLAALTLELGDLGRLVGWQHLGQHLVDPDLGGDPFGRLLVVAGEMTGTRAIASSAPPQEVACDSRARSAPSGYV